MRLINNSQIAFKSSQINITSMADNHGDVLTIPDVIKTMNSHSDEIFVNQNSNSTKNVLAIAGDFFMNPDKKGILTDPEKTFGDVQYKFLVKLIYEFNKKFNSQKNSDVLYTPGNHCFGAGDDWLFNKLKNAPLNTLVSNIDTKNSPLFLDMLEQSDKFITEKVYELSDSKNPEIKTHTMFLGLTIPSTYYNPKTFNNIKFLDQTSKKDVNIQAEDLKRTIALLNEKVGNFKKEHPNGAVVLMSHMGNELSKIVAENVKDINLILNAHDHKDYSTMVGNTQILSHGQNNKFIRGVNLLFDDKGKLSYIKNQKYDTSPYTQDAKNDRSLSVFVNKVLEKDLEPLIRFDESFKNQKGLVFDNSVRYANTPFVNYVTSSIKKAAKNKYPNLDSVGIYSTIIRGGLKSHQDRTTFNNIDLLNMFKGADENVAALNIGTITGKELCKLIVENVKNNIKSPTRNGLIQWSDIKVNKTFIAQIDENNIPVTYDNAIKIRNSKTGEYEYIDLNKEYTILMSDKYILKDTKSLRVPKQIVHKFHSIPETYEGLFMDYIKATNGKVVFDEEIKEKRIL